MSLPRPRRHKDRLEKASSMCLAVIVHDDSSEATGTRPIAECHIQQSRRSWRQCPCLPPVPTAAAGLPVRLEMMGRQGSRFAQQTFSPSNSSHHGLCRRHGAALQVTKEPSLSVFALPYTGGTVELSLHQSFVVSFCS